MFFVDLLSKLRGLMVKTSWTYGQNLVDLWSKPRGVMVKTSWTYGQNLVDLWSKPRGFMVKTSWLSPSQEPPGASQSLPGPSQGLQGAVFYRGLQGPARGLPGSAGVFRNMVRGWGGDYTRGTGACVASLSGFDLFQNGRDQGLRCVA